MSNSVLFRLTKFCAVIVFCCSTTALFAQQASITEQTRSIKTYPFSDPDPVPNLTRKPVIYPYFAFDGYSEQGAPQNWQVVELENDHIRLSVLPQVGGKVFGAVEKSTGHEFIYQNDVLKFRRISLRGPWSSGGIEFNFGIIGHTPTTATPVDYLLRKNDDGSVVCYIGAPDWASRTRWSVAITLPADKAWFETNAMWYNPTPFDQSYYTWITAALAAREDLHYFYPGHYVVPHSFDIANAPWPLDESGRDISWYKNNDIGGSKSHFIFGEYEPFFAGYWHDLEFGSGHWARYDDVPGQKMWIWSLHRDGGIWEDLLTDKKGQYSEPQAGRLFSQVDHEFFQPYRGDAWREIWFPFKKLGGLSMATPEAAANIWQDGDTLRVRLNALQKIEQELVVQFEGAPLHREWLSLAPMAVYVGNFSLPQTAGRLEVLVGNERYFTNDNSANDIHRPIQYRPIDESTAEGLYLAGEFHEKQREFERAFENYSACLQRDKNHVRAMTRLALLLTRRGENEKALTLASNALSLQMYDPDANYAYGVIARRLGRLTDAKEALGWAARSLAHRSNAYCQMAEIFLQENSLTLALEYARRAIGFNRYNLNALEVQAIAQRKLGRNDDAQATLQAIDELDPLHHFVRFEQFLLETTPDRLHEFKSLIRHELPHETYLEMAIRYHQMGLEGEAATVLTHAPAHAMISLWHAFILRNSDSDKAASQLDKALAQSPKLIFPFREESIAVLEWAVSLRPDAWQPKYYLGTLLAAKGRIEQALSLLDSCRKPDYAPFYLTRAQLRSHGAAELVLADLQQALLIDQNSWRSWHFLIDHYKSQQNSEMALKLAQEASKKFPQQIVLTMDYAGALFNSGEYQACLRVLQKARVLPYEGSWEAHDLYLRTNVYLALQMIAKNRWQEAVTYLEQSKAYPEHLGSGEPYAPDFRLQNYLASLCFTKMGRKNWAQESLKAVREYTSTHGTMWGSSDYFGIRTLQEYGEQKLASKLVQQLSERNRDDVAAHWTVAQLTGDRSQIQRLESAHQYNARLAMLRDVVRVCHQLAGK